MTALDTLLTRIASFGELQAGWYSGYGEETGQPVSETVRTAAARFVTALLQAGLTDCRVYPDPEGGVQIELTTSEYESDIRILPDRIGIAIETIDPPESAEIYLKGNVLSDRLVDQAIRFFTG